MYIIDNGKTRKLIADEGKKITNSDRVFFTDFIYLCKNDIPENYEEVPRAIWKYYVEEVNPDVIELQAQNKDVNDTINVIMTALANSDEQNSTAIDAILLAIDELYTWMFSALDEGGE